MSMSYWRFIAIANTAKRIKQQSSNTPTGRNKIYKSQQGMIDKTKKLGK